MIRVVERPLTVTSVHVNEWIRDNGWTSTDEIVEKSKWVMEMIEIEMA
jgi:uncharacterized protein YjcR